MIVTAEIFTTTSWFYIRRWLEKMDLSILGALFVQYVCHSTEAWECQTFYVLSFPTLLLFDGNLAIILNIDGLWELCFSSFVIFFAVIEQFVLFLFLLAYELFFKRLWTYLHFNINLRLICLVVGWIFRVEIWSYNSNHCPGVRRVHFSSVLIHFLCLFRTLHFPN